MIIPVLYGYVPMMISPFASANSEAHLFLIDPLIFDDGRYEVEISNAAIYRTILYAQISIMRILCESLAVHQLLSDVQQLYDANHLFSTVSLNDLHDVRSQKYCEICKTHFSSQYHCSDFHGSTQIGATRYDHGRIRIFCIF